MLYPSSGKACLCIPSSMMQFLVHQKGGGIMVVTDLMNISVWNHMLHCCTSLALYHSGEYHWWLEYVINVSTSLSLGQVCHLKRCIELHSWIVYNYILLRYIEVRFTSKTNQYSMHMLPYQTPSNKGVQGFTSITHSNLVRLGNIWWH